MPYPTIADKIQMAEEAYQRASLLVARTESLFRAGVDITNLYADTDDAVARLSLLGDAVEKFAACAAVQAQIVVGLKAAHRSLAAANAARVAGAESAALSVERAQKRVEKLESEAQRLKTVASASRKLQKSRRLRLDETAKKLASAKSRLSERETDAKLATPAKIEPTAPSDTKIYGPYREASGRYRVITIAAGRRTTKNYATLAEAEAAKHGAS